MFKKFFQQTRKPDGFWGRVMIKMMNGGHSGLANWGFSHIDVEDTYDILDVGCGGGKNIEKWLKLCNKGTVTGVDYSVESVKMSRDRNQSAITEGRCKVIEGDVANLPFDEAQFDVVSAFETIYFWPNIQDAFISIHKIIKPNGRFMIVNEACDSRAEKWTSIIDGMTIYTKEQIIELLEKANFEIVVADKNEKNGALVVIAKKL